jgi:hypothetical protein
METRNALSAFPADPALLDFLGRVAAEPALELEWIDLLAQLEYVGCRKIVKSIAFEDVTLDVLRHVSEEASHAYLLKSVAEEGGLRDRSWRDGRFAAAGWGYFQELDRRISALPGAEGFRYPGVSWAVERRVLAFYPAYIEITRNDSLRRVLRRILVQEEQHGARFNEVEFPGGFTAAAARIEESLWPRFIAEAARLQVRSS